MAQTANPTPLCPTCGSRITPGAERCLVCGRILNEPAQSNARSSSARKPGVRLSLPIFLILLIVFFGADAGLAYYAIQGRSSGSAAQAPTRTATVTQTPTITATLEPTRTPPPPPTATPLPDIEYKIGDGDTCLSIAIHFHISLASLLEKNNLPQACDNLSVGQKILVPQPTVTPSPEPSATAGATEAAKANCEVADYEVAEGDSLSRISRIYNVSMEDIKVFNNLLNDNVLQGSHLQIPLCKRKPADGSTPTPTQPPDYAAAALLLPLNGTVFPAGDEPGLQWSSVGNLRENEAYAVIVIDVTAEADTGQLKRLYETTRETQFSIPATFHSSDGKDHFLTWSIQPVRQTGTNQSGNPIWRPAGPASEIRQLVWAGK
ncbi:MAG TPA: LysM peptidoglycan-binding domain-containing protein [Anaerolineaceae bacterium]|nr:LysM peptidoglycan-binding domain-containing protein [Anaerolineaceae bacterium]